MSILVALGAIALTVWGATGWRSRIALVIAIPITWAVVLVLWYLLVPIVLDEDQFMTYAVHGPAGLVAAICAAVSIGRGFWLALLLGVLGSIGGVMLEGVLGPPSHWWPPLEVVSPAVGAACAAVLGASLR